MVIGPRVYEETDAVILEINVRNLDREEQGLESIDGVYTYEEATLDEFLTEIYPETVDRFEQTFAEAELQYYPP